MYANINNNLAYLYHCSTNIASTKHRNANGIENNKIDTLLQFMKSYWMISMTNLEDNYETISCVLKFKTLRNSHVVGHMLNT